MPGQQAARHGVPRGAGMSPGIKQAEQDTPVGNSKMLVKEICSMGLHNLIFGFINLLLFCPSLKQKLNISSK